MAVTAIAAESPVKIIDNFLSVEDCSSLIHTYSSCGQRSRVVIVNSDGTSSTSNEHHARTSTTHFIPSTDPIIIKLKDKVSDFLKVDKRNIENIQFLKYTKGERYLWHHDFLTSNNITNQREDTIIVYLNDLDETDGGATAFFHYKLKVCPKMGRAVWFKNCNPDGTIINQSLHAGEEIVTDSVKYALNVWVRQKPLY